MKLVLLNKPFRVLSQFTDGAGRSTLADFIREKDIYPAGRLDFDSEGLILLTDDGQLQARIAHPRNKLPKTYWVQVEGEPVAEQVEALTTGIKLKDGFAKALQASKIDEPVGIWTRTPPIRVRKSVPDAWLEITIDEGRNRQVRRMCAAVGLPALRLIRQSIGPWRVHGLKPGESQSLSIADAQAMLAEFDV